MTSFPASVPTTLPCVWEAQPESMKPSFWSVDTTGCLKPRASDGPLGAHGDHTSGIYRSEVFGDSCRGQCPSVASVSSSNICENKQDTQQEQGCCQLPKKETLDAMIDEFLPKVSPSSFKFPGPFCPRYLATTPLKESPCTIPATALPSFQNLHCSEFP